MQPVQRPATDAAAVGALGEYASKEPFERGVAIYCHNEEVAKHIWAKSSPGNACKVRVNMPYSESCWPGEGGNKATGCNLSLVHTHPWFTEDDASVMCHGDPVGDDLQRIFRLNRGGMRFSWEDEVEVRGGGIEGHLGVSNRTCVKAFRRSGRKETISGMCERVEPPEEEAPQ